VRGGAIIAMEYQFSRSNVVTTSPIFLRSLCAPCSRVLAFWCRWEIVAAD